MLQIQKQEKNILLIDNSPLITERLINMLREIPVNRKIYKSTNYKEAVGILNSNDINLVLLDIQLPEKNGIELLKHIVQSFPSIKVVIISNLASIYYQRLCKTLGAVAFIDKSKDFDQIPELVSSI